MMGEMRPRKRTGGKLALAFTDSDGVPASIIVAEGLGFMVDVLRYPSIEAVTWRLPDVVLVDWSPNAIEKNSALIREIRSTAAVRDVPIFIFYSSKDDVPEVVWSMDRVVPFEIPFPPEALERAFSRYVEGWTPHTSDSEETGAGVAMFAEGPQTQRRTKPTVRPTAVEVVESFAAGFIL